MNSTSSVDARPSKGKSFLKFLLVVILIVAAFLAGFWPMYQKTGGMSEEVTRMENQLYLERMQLSLADAALQARQENFDVAREKLEIFFKQLSTEIDRGAASALPEEAFYDLQPLMDEREDIMAQIAAKNAEVAERLSQAYVDFAAVMPTAKTAPTAPASKAE